MKNFGLLPHAAAYGAPRRFLKDCLLVLQFAISSLECLPVHFRQGDIVVIGGAQSNTS